MRTCRSTKFRKEMDINISTNFEEGGGALVSSGKRRGKDNIEMDINL